MFSLDEEEKTYSTEKKDRTIPTSHGKAGQRSYVISALLYVTLNGFCVGCYYRVMSDTNALGLPHSYTNETPYIAYMAYILRFHEGYEDIVVLLTLILIDGSDLKTTV